MTNPPKLEDPVLWLRYEAFSKFASEVNQSKTLIGLGEVIAQNLKFLINSFAGRFSFNNSSHKLVYSYFRGQCSLAREVDDSLGQFDETLLHQGLPQLWVKSEIAANPLLADSQFNHPKVTYLLLLPILAPDNQGTCVVLASKDDVEYKSVDFQFGRLIGELLQTKVAQLVSMQALKQKTLQLEERNTELLIAQKIAEGANQTRNEFLANMSHELRTPLNGILGYAQILERDVSLTEAQKQQINIISQSGEHLLDLINDILELSKVEAGQAIIELSEFNLSKFLATIVNITRIQAEQKKLTFVHEELSDLPVLVHGDAKRLRQVLTNLLGNAIKFTHEGEVCMKVGYHDGQIRFQIEDSGIGIDENDLEKIFLPFYQVGSIYNKHDGAGLGLAISQRLAKMMGSEIKAASSLGEGSTFWFTKDLPETKKTFSPSFQYPQRIVGIKGQAFRVLVVDNQPENRELLRDALTPLGVECFEAMNGRDALKKVKTIQPQLILMDIHMPGLDGLETTRRIRRLSGIDDMIIIAISASAFNQDRENSLAVGCNDFMTKPVRLDSLLERLQQFLGHEWIYETDNDR